MNTKREYKFTRTIGTWMTAKQAPPSISGSGMEYLRNMRLRPRRLHLYVLYIKLLCKGGHTWDSLWCVCDCRHLLSNMLDREKCVADRRRRSATESQGWPYYCDLVGVCSRGPSLRLKSLVWPSYKASKFLSHLRLWIADRPRLESPMIGRPADWACHTCDFPCDRFDFWIINNDKMISFSAYI